MGQSEFSAPLNVSCESKSLFFEVWWHKGWLAIPDMRLSREVEESSSGGIFFSGRNFQFVRFNAQSLHILRAHCEKLTLPKHSYFQDKQLGLCSIKVSLLLKETEHSYPFCGTYTQWSITQPLKRIHLNQF